MKKFVCSVCGYVHEGDRPRFLPQCKAPKGKSLWSRRARISWAAEHVVGVAQGASEDIMADLRMNFRASAPKWACIWPWRA